MGTIDSRKSRTSCAVTTQFHYDSSLTTSRTVEATNIEKAVELFVGKCSPLKEEGDMCRNWMLSMTGSVIWAFQSRGIWIPHMLLDELDQWLDGLG